MSEGNRLQMFRFFGGRVWSEGKKKRQAQADCVRPSRAPTSLNRDMDGGPFLVYFLPILGGQKAAVSDLVEGWCAAGNLRAFRVSIRMDDRTNG